MEQLQDILDIKNLDSLKKADLVKALRKVQHMVKANKKEDKVEKQTSEGLEHEAVSVVGNNFITIKFELDDNKELSTNKAVVVNLDHDSRDTGNQNHMATFNAVNKLKKIAVEEKKKLTNKIRRS